MALYTPFFERAMATVEQGRQRGRINETAQRAYLGDQQAMAELQGIAPDIAESMQRTAIMGGEAAARGAQAAESARLAQQREQRLQAAEQRQRQQNEQDYQQKVSNFFFETAEEMTKFDDFDSAQAFVEQKISNSPYQEEFDIQQFTPEMYEQYRAVYKDVADQRERQKNDYMRLFDMSEEEATKIVDSVKMMDDRGNITILDPITGNARLVSTEFGEEPATLTAPETFSVEDLAYDPGKGTGFLASMVGLWNRTAGQIPFVPVGLDAEEAAQNLRVLERDSIRALASSSRPPVIEQERLMSLIPNAMQFFQSPDVARFQMTNFLDLMMNQYIDDLRYAEDKRNPREVRSASVERANNIESIIRRTVQPEAATQMFNTLRKIEADISEISAMSTEELMELDISQLSDAQLDVYEEKLRGDSN